MNQRKLIVRPVCQSKLKGKGHGRRKQKKRIDEFSFVCWSAECSIVCYVRCNVVPSTQRFGALRTSMEFSSVGIFNWPIVATANGRKKTQKKGVSVVVVLYQTPKVFPFIVVRRTSMQSVILCYPLLFSWWWLLQRPFIIGIPHCMASWRKAKD